MLSQTKKHYLKQVISDFYIDKIKYFEADINYTMLYFQDGTVKRSAYSLKNFEQLLQPNKLFLRIHKSYIINTNHISKVDMDKAKVVMEVGAELPISRRKMVEFNKSNIFLNLGKKIA
jgi:DNA-binding LytR/AlgR family response regulator